MVMERFSSSSESSRVFTAVQAADDFPYQRYASSSNYHGSALCLGHGYDIVCKWEPLRKLILMQWARVLPEEVDSAGPNRRKLATLIVGKYGMELTMIENYLRNLERLMPLV